METLDGTSWDIVISGTGLQQSLLALALSRTGRKILHIDKNSFYGGPEAAFSLQEAQEWADKIRDSPSQGFQHAACSVLAGELSSDPQLKLSFSRAYSLALAPQIIYSRSALLQALVSSKVYRQLDFQAVGNWHIYERRTPGEGASPGVDLHMDNAQNGVGILSKVPNGREDIFSAENIDFRAKRSLMNFLRFVADFEQQTENWDAYRSRSLPDFLADQYHLPRELHEPLLALTLSPEPPEATTTEYALPRIARHLRSIGVFGPGFGAVIPKWGGLAEITQVACRAGAVGGAVYVLGRGVNTITEVKKDRNDESPSLQVVLDDGSAIETKWVIGADDDLSHILPHGPHGSTVPAQDATTLSRSVSIVAPSMSSLLPPVAENAPTPAGALVVLPAKSIAPTNSAKVPPQTPPVHIIIHSSETGECPDGQAVLYASTSATGEEGFNLLETAVERVLESVEDRPRPKVLWSMRYEQSAKMSNVSSDNTEATGTNANSHVICFPPAPLDLALDDVVLERVRDVWQKVIDEEGDGFMAFEDRDGASTGDYGDDS